MELKNVRVNHKEFGDGIIKQYDNNYMTVAFSEEEKLFQFSSFRKYLIVLDDKVNLAIEIDNAPNKEQKGCLSKFTICKNDFLTKIIIAYYNRPYTGYGNRDNPNFLNTLKNTFNDESLSELHHARQVVETILLEDLPQIIKLHNFQNSVCMCIPRAKALKTYTDNQLFFRDAVCNAANKISDIIDGTDVVVRHTNTRTTHLPEHTGRVKKTGWADLNAGKNPYPGITRDSCFIDRDKIIGKKIILVDDIYTKNVNIDEDCIQALLDNGAQEVILYVVGRTGGY